MLLSPDTAGSTAGSTRSDVLAALRERIRHIDRAPEKRVLSFGIAAVDDALPAQGLACNGLHEIFGESAARLGFVAALLGLQPSRDPVLWCRLGDGVVPHGPGLAAFGLAPERLILVHARREAELLWVMEEALRCRRLTAVLGENVAPSFTAGRRLQLAAETGGTPAFTLLSPSARSPPSVALTRWRIATLPTRPEMPGCIGPPRWQVSLTRCRGGGRGEWMLEWDDEALRLDLVATLGDRSLAAAE